MLLLLCGISDRHSMNFSACTDKTCRAASVAALVVNLGNDTSVFVHPTSISTSKSLVNDLV